MASTKIPEQMPHIWMNIIKMLGTMSRVSILKNCLDMNCIKMAKLELRSLALFTD